MTRKKGPALYELISAKPEQPKVVKTTEVQYHDENLEHNVLTPGRSIRVSVGSIGVIASICIALIVISYTMGYKKGTAVSREDYGNRLFQELPQVAFSEVEHQGKIAVNPKNQDLSNNNSSWLK